MDHNIWIQETLPTSKGGLGIRRSVDLSLPTFLSSSHATLDLVTSILPTDEPNSNFLLSEATCLWEERSGRPIPPQRDLKHQRAWDEALVDHAFDTIKTTIDTSSRARLLSVSTKESGAWLDVLPAPHLGTKLHNDSIHIATGLRLRADIVVEHSCICGHTISLLVFSCEQILWLNTPAFVVIPYHYWSSLVSRYCVEHSCICGHTISLLVFSCEQIL